MESFERLEKEFGEWIGLENGVGVSSGTAALHVGIEALQLPLGSEVLCPDLTMIACARAITLAGHVPVFVECDNSLLMNLDLADEFLSAANHNIRGVMPVHIYGRRMDMGAVLDLAEKYDLAVIEDSAECPLPCRKGARRPDASAFSFYKNKPVCGEEGGLVAFRDPARAALARQLRCLGFTPDHDFRHLPHGMNYRLANSLARLVLDSLARAHDNLRARRRIEGWYDSVCPAEWRMPPREVVWCYDVKIPNLAREAQARVVRALNAAGVAARMGFLPMHMQEEYRDCRRVGGEVAEAMANQCFYLPVQPGATTEESARLAFAIIKKALA